MSNFTLITGRTLEQGRTLEIGKFTKDYMDRCAICEINHEDLKKLVLNLVQM